MKRNLLLLFAGFIFSQSASALTYTINLSGFDAIGSTITGTMTYNSVDAIGAPDSWDLSVTSTKFSDFGEANPTRLVSGLSGHFATYIGLDGLNARASGLTFNMDAGPFLLIANGDGLSGSNNGFCIGGVGSNSLVASFPNALACEGGIGIVVQNGVENQGTSSGIIPLGQVAAVPLPGAAGLFLLGLACISAFKRKV